jgi:hypothetical protein
MSEYENDMIKLIKQIADDIRWLRQRAEERDRIKKHDDQELLERIEQTHRGPQKPWIARRQSAPGEQNKSKPDVQ